MPKPHKTIRASALNLAVHCPGAHALAKKHPTENQFLSRGIAVHKEIADVLECNATPSEELAPFFKWLGIELEWMTSKTRLFSYEEELTQSWTADGQEYRLTGHADAIWDAFDSLAVVDWKTGGGFHLPPIDEDWQLMAYAAMANGGKKPDREISIYRVMVDERSYDVFDISDPEYGEENMDDASEAVREIAQTAMDNADKRTPGAHCEHCLPRRHCPERMALAGGFEVALGPSRGAAITSPQDAVRLLESLGPVKDAIKWSEEALKEYVLEVGPISDGNGRSWGPATVRRDKVRNAWGVLLELGRKLNRLRGRPEADGAGAWEAWEAAEVRKSKADALMKAAGADKSSIRDFWNFERGAGRIEQTESERFEWRKDRR